MTGFSLSFIYIYGHCMIWSNIYQLFTAFVDCWAFFCMQFRDEFRMQLQSQKECCSPGMNCFSIWSNNTARQIHWIITSWRAVSGLSLKTVPDQHAIKSVKVYQRAVMASEAAEAWTHDFAERISKLKAGRQTSLSLPHIFFFRHVPLNCCSLFAPQDSPFIRISC